jgi:hypothetical protein
MKDSLFPMRLLFIFGLATAVLAEPFQGVGTQLPILETSPFNENKTMDEIKRSLSLKYQALVKKVFNREISPEEAILENGSLPGNIFENGNNSSRNLIQLNRLQSNKNNSGTTVQPFPSIATDSGIDRVELNASIPNGGNHNLNEKDEFLDTNLNSNERELLKDSSHLTDQHSMQSQDPNGITVKGKSYSINPMPLNLHFNIADKRQEQRRKTPSLFTLRKTSESPFFKQQSSLVLDSQTNGTSNIIKAIPIENANHENNAASQGKLSSNVVHPVAEQIQTTSHEKSVQSLAKAHQTENSISRTLAKSHNNVQSSPTAVNLSVKPLNAPNRAKSLLIGEEKTRYVSNLRQALNEQGLKDKPLSLSNPNNRSFLRRANLQVKEIKSSFNEKLHQQYQKFKEEIASQSHQRSDKHPGSDSSNRVLRNARLFHKTNSPFGNKLPKTQRFTVRSVIYYAKHQNDSLRNNKTMKGLFAKGLGVRHAINSPERFRSNLKIPPVPSPQVNHALLSSQHQENLPKS